MSRYLSFGRLVLETVASPPNSIRFHIRDTVSRLLSTVGGSGSEETPIKPTSGSVHARDFRTDNVLPKLRERFGARFEFRLQHVNEVCNYLASDGASSNAIVDLFVRQPSLGDVPLRRWMDAIDVLRSSAGLPMDAIVEMITECPQIVVRVTRTQLESSLDVLRRERFGGKFLSLLLSRAPLLVVTSPNFLTERLQRLKGLVTHGDLFQLLPVCPNIMFDDWEVIEEVVQYIVVFIGLDQKQMVNSRVLSYPLSHVRIRHQLMTRTGKFHKPHPKREIVNPHLSKMVDTSVEDFVSLLGITVEEYEIFERIYEKELQNECVTQKRANEDDTDQDDSESEDD